MTACAGVALDSERPPLSPVIVTAGSKKIGLHRIVLSDDPA